MRLHADAMPVPVNSHYQENQRIATVSEQFPPLAEINAGGGSRRFWMRVPFPQVVHTFLACAPALVSDFCVAGAGTFERRTRALVRGEWLRAGGNVQVRPTSKAEEQSTGFRVTQIELSISA